MSFMTRLLTFCSFAFPFSAWPVVPIDELVFTPYPDNPVLTFTSVSGGFDATRVEHPTVVNVDGTYYLYYAGLGFGNPYETGLATSTDGINWTRHPENPVLSRTEESWSSFRVIVASVLYEDGFFKMWYLGDNRNLFAAHSLGYATSTDGVHWDRYAGNPIFPEITSTDLRIIDVAKHDGQYYLYYGKGADTYLATSTDGINWTNHPNNPILPGRGATLVTILQGEFIAFLSDGRMGASSDGITFTFTDESKSLNGLVTSALIEDDTFKVWYEVGVGNVNWNFGNTEIHYATAPMPAPAVPIDIDIMPDSDRNPINPKSKGLVPVAILTTDTFDAATVDSTTVAFGPDKAKQALKHAVSQDTDGDGDHDLLFHFRIEETGIQCGDMSASLAGTTFDGRPIGGEDAITTVGCKKQES